MLLGVIALGALAFLILVERFIMKAKPTDLIDADAAAHGVADAKAASVRDLLSEHAAASRPGKRSPRLPGLFRARHLPVVFPLLLVRSGRIPRRALGIFAMIVKLYRAEKEGTRI